MNRRIHSTGSSSILEVPQKLPHSRSKACIKKQSVSKSNLSSRPCRRMPLQPDGGARGGEPEDDFRTLNSRSGEAESVKSIMSIWQDCYKPKNISIRGHDAG